MRPSPYRPRHSLAVAALALVMLGAVLPSIPANATAGDAASHTDAPRSQPDISDRQAPSWKHGWVKIFVRRDAETGYNYAVGKGYGMNGEWTVQLERADYYDRWTPYASATKTGSKGRVTFSLGGGDGDMSGYWRACVYREKGKSKGDPVTCSGTEVAEAVKPGTTPATPMPQILIAAPVTYKSWERFAQVPIEVIDIPDGVEVTISEMQVQGSREEPPPPQYRDHVVIEDGQAIAEIEMGHSPDIHGWDDFEACWTRAEGRPICSKVFTAKGEFTDPWERTDMTPEAQQRWIEETLADLNKRRVWRGLNPLTLNTSLQAEINEHARKTYEQEKLVPVPNEGINCHGYRGRDYAARQELYYDSPDLTTIAIGVYWDRHGSPEQGWYFASLTIAR